MKTKNIYNSSQVVRIEYEEETKTFFVTYKTGKTYAYHDVDPELWDKVCEAESIGKFVNEHIKSHQYDLVK